MGVPYAEVIGDPIAHSKSPMIHEFWLEKLGIEGDYRRAHVTPGELPSLSRRAPRRPRLARLQRHHAAQAGDRAELLDERGSRPQHRSARSTRSSAARTAR